MALFVNPMALYGLGLASAPIIIHLLNRRRFRVVEWAAMEFLLASSRKNFRRIRIEQLLLLALRVLLIAVLILLVSRPVVRRSAVAGLTERRRFVLLVFDSSMSMGYRDGTLSSYDKGLAYAERLMGSLGEGDSWALVVAKGRGRSSAVEPSFGLEAARAAVAKDRLPLCDTDAAVPAALGVAAGLLSQVDEPGKEIHVVTDMQRGSWLPASGLAQPEDRQRLAQLSRSAALTLVDVGPEAPANLAVVGLEAEDPRVVVGKQTTLLVRVANFGPATARGVRVALRFRLPRRPTEDLEPEVPQSLGQAKDIGSGASALWAVPHTFAQEGSHKVAAELVDGDHLNRDDRRFLAVDVRRSVRVLCVEEEPARARFAGATGLLRHALCPDSQAGGGTPKGAAGPRLSLFEPEVVAVRRLEPSDLPDYDTVVLADVARLEKGGSGGPVDLAPALDRYVREGGALVVFLGERIDRDYYNRVLFRDGRGLLPCSLGDVVGELSEGAEPAHIADELGDHPFLQFFRTHKTVPLSRAPFSRYYRLEGVEGREGVRVVCRFEGGAPAMVEADRGRGRVVVFASTADKAWNLLSDRLAYLTLWHETLEHVARKPGTQSNVSVGEPLVARFPPQAAKTVRLLRPDDAEPTLLQATTADGIVGVSVDKTDRAGIYELMPAADAGAGTAGSKLFAVNCPPHESDTRRITAEDLRRKFEGFEFTYRRGEAWQGPAGPGGQEGELWRWLAYTLVAMLFMESVLAQRFSK